MAQNPVMRTERIPSAKDLLLIQRWPDVVSTPEYGRLLILTFNADLGDIKKRLLNMDLVYTVTRDKNGENEDGFTDVSQTRQRT